MQFVMIRLTNTESCFETSNRTAWRIWSTRITSVAMIVICTAMRMLLGMWWRMTLTARPESPVTTTTQTDMTSAVSIFDVTASAEQMPSTWSAIGFLLKTGSNRTSFARNWDTVQPPFRIRSR